MKTYKVIFSCNSRINKIPDAQTIFGAICNSIKLYKGEEKFAEYLDSLDDKPLMVHSSMFPENLFPAMKSSLFSSELISQYIMSLQDNQQLEAYSKLKSYKRIKYVSKKIYDMYLANDRIKELKTDLIKNDLNFELNDDILKTKDETIEFEYKDVLATRIKHFSNVSGEDSELYYDHDIYFRENQKFVVYVKTDLEKIYVEDIFNKFDFISLGNRSSVGKNIFKYVETMEMITESLKVNSKLLLSKCIPNENEFNYSNSNYNVQSQNYISSKEFGNEIIGTITKFTEGSYMKVIEDKEYYGKCLPIKINNKIIYHYGIGFVL